MIIEHPTDVLKLTDEEARVALLAGASDLISKALIYATDAHASIDQRRKYCDKPYIVHPVRVALILKRFGESVNDKMICAALMHDVVEDTPITIEEVYEEFCPEISRIVSEVTNISKPEDGNRKFRKAIDRDHLAGASYEGQSLKYCDILHNTYDIVANDPNFARVYLHEIKANLNVMEIGDSMLRDYAYESVDCGWETLNHDRDGHGDSNE